MRCQHGCDSWKQEVYIKLRELHTLHSFHNLKTLRPFGVTLGLTLQNYSCVSVDETGDTKTLIRSEMPRFNVSATSTNSASDLLSSAASFHHSLLPTSCLIVQCRLQKESDVIVNALHLCNVILDGLLRGNTVRNCPYQPTCWLRSHWHLADSSTLFEVAG